MNNCKIYFKHKNGKSLLDNIYFTCKSLSNSDVEFLTKKNTKNNILKKLDLIKNSKDVNINLNSLEKRWLKDYVDLKMFDYIYDNLKICEKEDGYVNISKYVNFKIVVKVVN